MAPVADDREHVEDLVEAEPARAGVGLLDAVDDGAQRVGEAADGDEPDDRRAVRRRPELGHVAHRDPPERDVDGHVHPPRGVEPQDPGEEAEQGPAPHDREQDRRGPLGEQEHGEGRVGARDDEEDVRVVGAAEHARDAGRPRAAVVHGARAEQEARAEAEDRGRDLAGDGWRDDDEDDARDEREGERPGVDPAAQARLDDLGDLRDRVAHVLADGVERVGAGCVRRARVGGRRARGAVAVGRSVHDVSSVVCPCTEEAGAGLPRQPTPS